MGTNPASVFPEATPRSKRVSKEIITRRKRASKEKGANKTELMKLIDANEKQAALDQTITRKIELVGEMNPDEKKQIEVTLGVSMAAFVTRRGGVSVDGGSSASSPPGVSALPVSYSWHSMAWWFLRQRLPSHL